MERFFIFGFTITSCSSERWSVFLFFASQSLHEVIVKQKVSVGPCVTQPSQDQHTASWFPETPRSGFRYACLNSSSSEEEDEKKGCRRSK